MLLPSANLALSLPATVSVSDPLIFKAVILMPRLRLAHNVSTTMSLIARANANTIQKLPSHAVKPGTSSLDSVKLAKSDCS